MLCIIVSLGVEGEAAAVDAVAGFQLSWLCCGKPKGGVTFGARGFSNTGCRYRDVCGPPSLQFFNQVTKVRVESMVK